MDALSIREHANVDDLARREANDTRQTYLDECLRIAVWELIYGSGRQRRVDELLAEGAQWRHE